ncbi:DinB family protein [Angustibacter peucedani]
MTDTSSPADARVDPPLTADERTTLTTFLDWHRATLEHKCAGLDDDQLRQRAAAPSTLSLLGLVRHLAEVERTWFRRVLDGEDVGLVWSDERDFQAAYEPAGSVEEAWAAWRHEVARAREITDAAPSLDVTGLHQKWGEHVSLRWVLVHMVEEYARHNGHADIVREAVDGTTGE